jgi:hypothetical protein
MAMSGNDLYARAPNYAGGSIVPLSNFGSTSSNGMGSGNAFSPYARNALAGGIGSIASGLFNDSGAPYNAAMDQYQKYYNQAQNTQQPFLNAGTGAIPNYQNFLSKMQNPTDFINNISSQYKESPYAQYQQQQARRAAENFGSANGLSGSTLLMQQAQQNASNISSQDMNNWLQNVLGVNQQYGQGQQNLIQGGQNSANSLTNLLSMLGNNMGQAAYGQEAGNQSDFSNILGGLGSLAAFFL